MRIGIDCRLWNESGVGRYIRNLIEQLQILDHKNDYVLFVRSKDLVEVKSQSFDKLRIKVKSDNWKIVVADIRWHTIEEQLRFSSILNGESLDLVHFPYFSAPIFYNKPFVVTIHDLILHHFPTGEASTLPFPFYQLKLIGYKFIISKLAKKAKRILTVSNATKDEIIDHLKVDPSRVVVTYEGVFDKSKVNPFDKLRVDAERSRSIKSQKSKVQLKIKNYFLYVGNAYPHKNLERLIEAFSLFCHPDQAKPDLGSQSNRDSDFRQNDTKLVLVGKEDYFYKRLKEKVKNIGLQKSVLFHGEVTDEELASLYRNAKALVIPSLMEGFGLPVLEAMENKCLVLAADIPALREICGESAFYFNPYDIKDLVRKIDVILVSGAHPESLTAMGDAGQASMTRGDKIEKGFERAKMFSWEKMARETLEAYKNAVAY